MQLADGFSFEIYFGKIGEIKFPKTIWEFFDGTFQDLFSESSKKC
jgi:hypothetical protein